MKPFIFAKRLSIRLAVWLMRATSVPAMLVITLVALAGPSQAQEAPQVRSVPNAPGWITIIWEHSEKGVYGFVVERQGPPYDQSAIIGVAVLNSPTREFTDKFLKAATTYNHRVCAVYDDHRTCSDWVHSTTFAPPSSGGSSENKPPPPPPLSTPVLKARATSASNIRLEWDYSYADRLTSMALYRDDQFIFEGAIERNFTNGHNNPVRPNTEYTYKLCFSNPDEKNKCSEPVRVMGTPIAPTAPADVKVAFIPLGGRSVPGGALRLRPKPSVSLTWRNTDLPGQFITVEALDTVPGRSATVGSAQVQTAPRQRWIEATRISARNDPTTLTIGRPVSLITTDTGLTTYRICAVVPALGDNGKVCSQPASLP
jgi:hypothetical protein